MNQFTETFSILELAEWVAYCMGIDCEIRHIENPRVEKAVHYYNPQNKKIMDLGLLPTGLSDELIARLIGIAKENKDRIILERIMPTVRWNK